MLIDLLERPIITYLIVVLCSLIAAVLLFLIGGSFAEVTGQQQRILGVTFKAGGALAGFLIVLLFSVKMLSKFNAIGAKISRKEFVLRLMKDTHFGNGMKCSYCLFDTESGEWSAWKEIGYRKEAGGLKINVNEMVPRHVIRVRIENSSGIKWESEEDLAFGISLIVLKPA